MPRLCEAGATSRVVARLVRVQAIEEATSPSLAENETTREIDKLVRKPRPLHDLGDTASFPEKLANRVNVLPQ
jgi:hypothetical protein